MSKRALATMVLLAFAAPTVSADEHPFAALLKAASQKSQNQAGGAAPSLFQPAAAPASTPAAGGAQAQVSMIRRGTINGSAGSPELRIHSTAELKSPSVGGVKAGESVEVLGQAGDMTQIRTTGGAEGWVVARRVDMAPAVSPVPAATPVVAPPVPTATPAVVASPMPTPAAAIAAPPPPGPIPAPALVPQAPAVASSPKEDAPVAAAVPSEEKTRVKVEKPKLSETPLSGVTLRFDNADIYEVIHTIMGDILKLDYLMDPTISGKVTINTSGNISQADLFGLLEKVLAFNNISIVKDGKIYKFIKDANAARDATGFTAAGADSPVIQIVATKFVQASALVNVIKNFLGAQAGIVNDPTNHYLIIVDRASNVERAMDLLRVLDVDYLQHVVVRLVPVVKGDASEMAKEMETLFKNSGLFNWPGTEPNKVFFMPIVRMNAVLVAGSNDTVVEAAEHWIKALDDEPAEGLGAFIHVYRVENSNAAHIADIVRQVYGGAPSPSSSTSPTGGAAAAGGAEKVVVKGSVPGASATTASGQGLAGNVQIIPDEATNTLVIKASPQDYLQLKKVIERIDTIPRQVLIQVMVAEVGLTEDTQFGIEWWLQNEKLRINGNAYAPQVTGGGGAINLPAAPNLLSTAVGGFNYMVFNSANDVVAVLKALESTNNVSILSAPHIMASDGKEASIDVGKEVPVATQTVSTPATSVSQGFNTSSSFQYKQSGVILKVTPHINASGLVSLKISQEVSQPNSVTVNGQSTYEFSKRKVETDVTLQEGSALMIGGLIQNIGTDNGAGIPVLKDVPVLGYLFGSTEKKIDKTELMITITPYVVRNKLEADRVTSAFREGVASIKKLSVEADKTIPDVDGDNDVRIGLGHQPVRQPQLDPVK